MTFKTAETTRSFYLIQVYGFVHKITTIVNNILENIILFERMYAVVLKGTQRKMIKISGCADTVFEEAYFVLKPGSEKDRMSERDIIAEANRIIRENSSFSDRRDRRYVKMSFAVFCLLVAMSVFGTVSAALYLATLI